MLRVLITGDRNWSDIGLIMGVFNRVYERNGRDVVLIEGEARGADSLGRDVAVRLGWSVLPFPAEWDKNGKAAGPIRNRQMVNEGKPDVVFAFHSDITKSKGTKDMVRYSLECGLPVIYYNGKSFKPTSLPLFMLRWFNFNHNRAS